MDEKYRHEIKYICSEQDLVVIENRIKHLCEKDKHVGERGIYSIRSVYFDDYKNTCFYENENGTDPREKFRIRIYNGDTGRIVLECKKKKNGKNHKDSCLLSEQLCRNILQGSFYPVSQNDKEYRADFDNSLLNKFYLQYNMRMFRPKVIVEYERTPYVYQVGNVRITFDRNIAGTSNINEFLNPAVCARPVMPLGQHILEVKYDEFLPDDLYNAMQVRRLQRTAFSKYYTCRKYCR